MYNKESLLEREGRERQKAAGITLLIAIMMTAVILTVYGHFIIKDAEKQESETKETTHVENILQN